MAQDNFAKCWDILISNFGSPPQASTTLFQEEQQNYFNSIFEIYLNKTEQNLLEWIGKNHSAKYLTFKDWYEDPKTQKDIKQKNASKKAQNAKAVYTQTEHRASISEYDAPRKVDKTEYYLWDLIKKDFRPEELGIGLDLELLNKIKQQTPDYTTPFRENLLSYLASDATTPLVVSSDKYHKNLWGILVELSQRLRGYTYELVVSPSDLDYYLCPYGLWEPFSDSVLTQYRKDFIEAETRMRQDKVGFFSINVDDELKDDREFKTLLKFYTRSYKTIILLDSWFKVPRYHWLERELKDALTLEFKLND